MDGATTVDEKPPSQEVLDLWTDAYAKQANIDLRAALVCSDVRVPPGSEAKTDAIQVGLQYANGESVMVFPTKKGWLGRIQYGNLFASALDRQFFAGRD